VIARVRDSGPLEILVVNSGFAICGDALDQDPDEIDWLFRVNVHAPYHASVEVARQMPDGGRIIVIGSVNGDRMPVPGMASYALSKSALQGTARGLARDFGPRGITIDIVRPSTPMPTRKMVRLRLCCTASWRSSATEGLRKSREWSHGWPGRRRAS
jgi:cyclic-di-GMP-binding biofilm dispersal mediator protein